MAQKSEPAKSMRVVPWGDNEWVFEFPSLDDEAYDRFDWALDLWRMGDWKAAEKEYKQILVKYPEFIDVRHHLALVLDNTEREMRAMGIWKNVVKKALACLPANFFFGKDRLSWGILENRPFLRAYHSLGLSFLERNEVERALIIFENIIALNPGDNQGVRSLIVDCYFRLRRPLDVLRTCDLYPDDGMEGLVYGRVLALFQLDRIEEAVQALREAVSFLPLIAKELTKKRHPRPKVLYPGYVTQGGADQAYSYWEDCGPFWKATPGAIEWVRAFLGALD